jgi:hypothetical protein
MCSYVVLNKQANAPLTRPKVHIIPRKMKHIYNGYKKERGGGVHLPVERLQFICIIVPVRDSWIASHMVNFDSRSRQMFRNFQIKFSFRSIAAGNIKFMH